MIQTKDLFISYGRRESLSFVGRLHRLLKLQGYDAWFDKVNIPDGDDYVLRINNGIESAHNFVYVMSPRSLTSPYCLVELEYARILGKRVIPINQMVIFDTAEEILSETDQETLHQFYDEHQILDPKIKTSQDVLKQSLKLIGRTDWIDGKENLTPRDCEALKIWAQSYENQWMKHDHTDYVEKLQIPEFGKSIDPIESVVEHLVLLVDKQKYYVRTHTHILLNALQWKNKGLATRHLLVGRERTEAYDWLQTEFIPPKQPPCQVTDLQADFICESRKNGENLMTDLFLCHATEDSNVRDQVSRVLARHGITFWAHDRDIDKSSEFSQAIQRGIEQADNFVYFISEFSINSTYCQRELKNAIALNKRIIPILIEDVPESSMPYSIRGLQYIDFTDNVKLSDFEQDLDDILNTIKRNHAYFYEHKVLLVRALKWKREDKIQSFLLRGYNLENAQTWLRLNKDRKRFAPTDVHHEFIRACEATKGQLGADIFISYSQKDSDFARKLNTAFQEAGKTTWFDQESISSGVDFEKAIYKGIDNADNFVFIISPDSITSEYCDQEVNYAKSKNKRIITLLHRETDISLMPDALKLINWIDFQNHNFDKPFHHLVQIIDIDREHAHQHTVLQQRAEEWEDYDKSSDFLLNQTASETAENWLKEAFDITDEMLEEQISFAPKKHPVPTSLQIEYIQESRIAIMQANRKEKRRRNRLVLLAISAIGAFIIATIMGLRTWREMGLVAHKSTEIQQAYDSLSRLQAIADSTRQVVDEKLRQIHDYKSVAIESELEVHQALQQAQNERDKAQEALQKSEKLVQSISFSESENLAMVFDHGVWGYINSHGDRVIRPQYSNPRNFYLGYAYVNDAFFINTQGNRIKRTEGIKKIFSAMKSHPKAPDISVIELQSLKINRLSSNIQYLKNLRYFVLYDNNLTALPPEIGRMTSLTNLYLSRNKLTHLPDEITKLTSLTYLNLGMNQISRLPRDLKSLRNLKELDLRGNDISPRELKRIEKALPNCIIKY